MQLSIFAVFFKFLVNQRGSALLAFCPLVGGGCGRHGDEIGLEKMYEDARCFHRVTSGDSPAKVGQVINVSDGDDIDYIGIFIEDADCGGFFISLDRKTLIAYMEKADKIKV